MRPQGLTVLEGRVAVCRLDPGADMPSWFDPQPPVSSLVRTQDELTVVLPEDAIPDEVEAEGGWRVLRVEGPFDLRTTFGVIAGVTSPLAAAEVSVLSISTYDTDYLLIQDDQLERASQALRDAGHEVT